MREFCIIRCANMAVPRGLGDTISYPITPMVPFQNSGPHPEGPFTQKQRELVARKRRPDAPEAGDPILNQVRVIDLDAVFADYLDKARFSDRLSPTTLHNLATAYRNFRKFLLDGRTEETPLGRTLIDIDAWLKWTATRERRLTPDTVHTWWRGVRRFFAYLEAEYALPSPFAGRKAPPLGERVPKAKTPSECSRILEAAYQYYWPCAFDRARAVAMLAVVLYAGLRRSEVLRLKFLDVNFDEQVIFVRSGKGRGGGKDRMIMMAPDLRRILETYLRERRRANLNGPEFFSSLKTRAGVSWMTFRRIVAVVRDASQVPFTLHSLRHSFVTQLLRSGVPIHTVASLAGHAHITTTENYSSVWDDDKRLAVRHLTFDDRQRSSRFRRGPRDARDRRAG
jgi:site-specific recombinase XerD